MITKSSDQKNFLQVTIDKSPGALVKLKDLIDQAVILNSFQDPWISSYPSYLAVKIVLEKNVSVDIIDDLINFEDLLKLSSIEHEIEFDLHENSKLFYTCKLKPQISLEYNQAILQELSDSNLSLTKRLTFNLTGSNAHAKIRIRSLAVSSQKFKFYTLQNHLHADTFSCLCLKNVLFDSAKIECDNKIKVHEDAFKSFANQVNRNLIIGQNAHVISSPALEIENDDVKCKHGAVTKIIDEEQLFYLQNRGIDSVIAKQMLVKGFLN
ncbi:MAG: SufD family Fe-S cluster assembly protein [bacterium]